MTLRAKAAADLAELTAIADWLRTVAEPLDVALLDEIMKLSRPTHSTHSVRSDGQPGTWRPARPVGRDPRKRLVKLLAVRYADRDGYRSEWQPKRSTTPEA